MIRFKIFTLSWFTPTADSEFRESLARMYLMDPPLPRAAGVEALDALGVGSQLEAFALTSATGGKRRLKGGRRRASAEQVDPAELSLLDRAATS